MSLFGTADDAEQSGYELPQLDEYPIRDLLTMEKEMAGMYLSGHPMAEYRAVAEALDAAHIGDILAASHGEEENNAVLPYRDGDRVTVLAIVNNVRTKVTKNNQTMAFVVLEDLYGAIEMLVFPKMLEQYASLLQEGRVLQITAKLSLREEEDAKLLCDHITAAPTPDANVAELGRNVAPEPPQFHERPESADSPAAKPAHSARYGLYLRVPNLACDAFVRAQRVMAVFDGNTPVYVYCTDTGKLSQAARGLWVSLNEPMLVELRRILGDGNVAVKE